MSDENYMDFIDGKRTKLEINLEKILSFNAICRYSVVDCFKNKSMEFFTEQLDDKSVRAYNTFNNTGEISKTKFLC